MEPLSERISSFIKAERAALVGYVRGLIGDAADRDGEDIVQDVVTGLLERADPLMPLRSVSAYVYQSIRNRVVDAFRSGKKNVPLDHGGGEDEALSLAETLHDARFDTEAEVAGGELREILVEAMDRLSDNERAIVIATELEGFSFRELSEMWDVPLGTLLAQKSRALAKLRESIPLKEYTNH
jgi:RNA polymerase sigma factor (sigma-70 family)